jgi:CheY-like chemotaxis protein
MSKALKKFVQDLVQRVGEGLSGLLASEIALTAGEISGFSPDSLTRFGDEFVAVLSAAVTEPYEGTVYVAFDLNRVVILGALLEMVPPEGIKERLREPTFNEDNADAFEEVGNILVGKLDEAIRNTLGKAKIHTKKGDTLHGPPAEVLAAIEGHGDYYCLDATLEVEGQEAGPVAFLFHPTLIEDGFQADAEATRRPVAAQVTQEAEAAEPGGVSTTATIPPDSPADDQAHGPGIPTNAQEPDDGGVGTTAGAETGEEDRTSATASDAEIITEDLLSQAMASDPMVTAMAPEVSRRTAQFDAGTQLPGSHGRPVLLVVDDDITTRVMIRTYLEGAGISIFEAVSWREAGLFLRSRRVDAILLDLYLSDLNGIDACRKLHLHPSTRSAPVFLCTSRPSREAVVKGLKAGAADFLIKPFTRDKLIEKLDTVLQTA